jgi:predicted nucleic acid-binding protein
LSTRFLPDTTVIVAVLCGWHEQHRAAVDELERRLAAAAAMVVAGPSLVEAYAVLTRLAAPYRMSPAHAHALISANFVHGQEVVTLPSESYLVLLDRLLATGASGGQAHAALVAECARQSRVDALITFDARPFRSLVDPNIALVVPGAA